MILKTENAELYDIMKSFYEITGIKTAVYNTDREEILAYPPQNSDLCTEIRKKYTHCCEQSNRILFEKCEKADDLVISKCHAGLTEAAAPIKDNGILIGYIMYGQITNNANPQCVQCNRVLCSEHTSELVSKIKYYSDDRIKAVSKIFNALISYIVLKHYVYTEEMPLICRIAEYINTDLNADLSVGALCKRFCVSRSELYKISKPYMPDGIAEFVKSSRLRYAAEQLRKTDKPAQTIAEECGFADKDYFLRVFKKHFGMSAGRYRKTKK